MKSNPQYLQSIKLMVVEFRVSYEVPRVGSTLKFAAHHRLTLEGIRLPVNTAMFVVWCFRCSVCLGLINPWVTKIGYRYYNSCTQTTILTEHWFPGTWISFPAILPLLDLN